MAPSAREVWRDYEVDGVPSSGLHNVLKSDARTWGTDLEGRVIDAETAMQAAEEATAAAEAASAAAELATQKADQAAEIVDTLVFAVVATRSELKAVDTTQFNTAYLQEAGREGWFDFRNGNYAARVAADSQEGVVIKANAIAAISGAWVRSKFFDYDTRQFGGAGTAGIQAIETIGGGVYRVGGGVAGPILPATFLGTVVDYDGPLVDINFFAESGPEIRKAKRAWKMQHGGPHAGETLSGFHIQSTITGSGRNGPNNASIGQSISSVKKNAPSGAAFGEVDGLYIVIRQGGPTPTSFNNSSDHSGILIDSSSYENCGHGFAIETALRNLDSAGNVLYQVQTQMGGIQTNWAAFNPDGSLNGTPLGTRFSFGFNSQMLTGMGDVAYLVEGVAQWDRAFSVGSVKASASMYIGGDGTIAMGTSANRFFLRNQSGTLAMRNAADTADIFRVDQTSKLYLGSSQVITTRRTGWAASAGTPSRATFNADTAVTFATASASYNQTEIQNLRNVLVLALQNIHAIRADLTTHGLIGA
ncbi:hypothetical protein HGO37_07860 [Rhizobium sp. CG4]|uniref:hypothetical protein n=1 Tax=Rhizobium sp. CG4 TaxID=2726075 RepID=UPI0020348783|nr:hypothetical protein [Rhizobium sp. CG4]MCM2455295.1 hypothetical protein [Rhizobium sp. CG4]